MVRLVLVRGQLGKWDFGVGCGVEKTNKIGLAPTKAFMREICITMYLVWFKSRQRTFV